MGRMRTRKKRAAASNHCYFWEFGTKNDQDYHFFLSSRNGLEDLLGRFSGLETTLLWGHKNLVSKLTGIIPDAKIQICLLGLPASARSPNLEKTFAWSQHVLSFD